MVKLTPIERGVLLALMAEGAPLREAADLLTRFKIRMSATHRKNLSALGLIRTTRSPFKHELTEKGWDWARAELDAVPPPGTMGLGPLYAVLHGIGRTLRSQSLDVQTFFATSTLPPYATPSGERDTLMSDASWSESEVTLAYALQDIPAFYRVIQKFDANSPEKQAASLRQIELAAESIFQNIRMAARKRGLALTHERGAETSFDPVTFQSGDFSNGDVVKVKKSPVVKSRRGTDLIVAKGIAEPAGG